MGKRTFAYIGNWWPKGKPEEGIAICEFDRESGMLTCLKNVYRELYIGAALLRKNVLYAVDERADLPGMRKGGGGQVVAFAIDAGTGELREISRSPSYGANPSYAVVDDEGKFLLVTNHGSHAVTTSTETDEGGAIRIKVSCDESSVVLFRLGDDGSIGEPCDVFRLSGAGPEQFQMGPHAHSIRKAPEKNLYAVCDKGGDQIYMLSIDYGRERLRLCKGSPYLRTAGSAPRYSVFHPTLPYLYVNKENKTIISVFRYDADGELQFVDSVSSLPEHIAPPDGLSQTDICISPDGRCLYTLLRLANAISVFEISELTGRLSRIQTLENVPAGGRGCAISPDGRFLVAASVSGSVRVYPIGEGGTLAAHVSEIEQPVPGTVTFFESD